MSPAAWHQRTFAFTFHDLLIFILRGSVHCKLGLTTLNLDLIMSLQAAA